jgi:hypothetical protein
LLTGGKSDSKKSDSEKRVRVRAIVGAEAARGKDCLGAWIGVSRKAPNPNFVSSDMSGEIQTDLDHKRNFLKACLCDAAIALEGGPGCIVRKPCPTHLHLLYRLAVVVMKDAAKDITTPHWTISTTAVIICWDVLSTALMRSGMVEIRHVLLQDPMQMLLI